MSTLLISYDLVWPETSSDYKKIKDYIESFPDWAKPLESFYFVISSKTVSTVRDELMSLTDSNDKILVMKVNWNAWGTSFSSEVTQWMKDNI